jgi:nucleoside-diphosphate-sugar epimerase
MPTALVTGIAGFIGSNLAEALLNRGYIVRGIDNFESGRESNLESLRGADNFTFRNADIRDSETMSELSDDVDYLFHQAAISSVQESIEDPVTTTDVNGTGTATVLDAARHADIDTAVVASSAAVYGFNEELPKTESMDERPETPYALSKNYTEKLALQYSDFYDIDTVALRYFNVFGPRQNPESDYAAVIPKFINLMLDSRRPAIFGDGEQSRDFVYIDDVVRANILEAERDVSGETFNIASGDRSTIDGLVTILNRHLGTDIDPIYDDPRPGDVRHSYADISRARRLLNYDPEVPFDDGLKRTIEYYRDD